MVTLKNIQADLSAQLQGRTGVSSVLSSILFGRGFHLLLSHRIQRASLSIPIIGKFISKIIWVMTSGWTGCDISIFAKLEGGLYIPHPTGIVIGQDVCIGSGTIIYQGVTIGQKSPSSPPKPIIGKNVCLGAGSKIIGDITIGDNCMIGANAVVTKSMADNMTAVGIPAKFYQNH